MDLATGMLGLRCTAQDALGNRCVKDAAHLGSAYGAERTHDASRGSLLRQW